MPKKLAKSVLDKSRSSSRSISPTNIHSSYYQRMNTNMQNYNKKNSEKSLFKLNSIGSPGDLDLSKSQRNIKNIGKQPTSTSTNSYKVNYDSFLEYLNDNVKNTANFGMKKKSYLSKYEKKHLKSSIESVIMPSDKRNIKQKLAKSNHVSIVSKNSSLSKPKLEINQTLNTSGLNKSKFDYGMGVYQKQYPRTTKNRAPSIKSKKSSGSTQRNNKSKSKSKLRTKEQSSLERSIEVLSIKEGSVLGTLNTKVSTDSSNLLCRKIKNDIKNLESSKLSKYLKS